MGNAAGRAFEPVGNSTRLFLHNSSRGTSQPNNIFDGGSDAYVQGAFFFSTCLFGAFLVLIIILIVCFIKLRKRGVPNKLCCMKKTAIVCLILCILTIGMMIVGLVIMHHYLKRLKEKYVVEATKLAEQIQGLLPQLKRYLTLVDHMHNLVSSTGNSTDTELSPGQVGDAYREIVKFEKDLKVVIFLLKGIWKDLFLIFIIVMVYFISCIIKKILYMYPIWKRRHKMMSWCCASATILWVVWFLLFINLTMVFIFWSDVCTETTAGIVNIGFTLTKWPRNDANEKKIKESMDYFIDCKGENPMATIRTSIVVIKTIAGAVTNYLLPSVNAMLGFLSSSFGVSAETVKTLQDDAQYLDNYVALIDQVNCALTSRIYKGILSEVCVGTVTGFAVIWHGIWATIILLFIYIIINIRIKKHIRESCKKIAQALAVKQQEIKKAKDEKADKKKSPKDKEKAKEKPVKAGPAGEQVPCGSWCRPDGLTAAQLPPSAHYHPALTLSPAYELKEKKFHYDCGCSIDVTPWRR